MSAVLSPPRSEQWMESLVRANAIRADRALLKRRIASGSVAVADVLAQRPPEAASWSLGGLLGAQARWGVVRVRKLLRQLGIAEGRMVGALTERQRKAVADALAPTPPFTATDRKILALLGQARTWVCVAELARGAGVESSEILGRVQALKFRGLVSRSPVELRRHAFGWRLTDLGSLELSAVMGAGG